MEELKNRFKNLSDEELLNLQKNPEALREIYNDLEITFSDALDLFHDYITNYKFSPKQKIIFEYYTKQNSIFENPTPRVLNAIRLYFKKNLNENIDNLPDNEILMPIIFLSEYNKRKNNLSKNLLELDLSEKGLLSRKFLLPTIIIDMCIDNELKKQTALKNYLKELDINDLLKFFLSRNELKQPSLTSLNFTYYNGKRITDLSKKFGISEIIIIKFISQEYHKRIKNLNESLSKYSQSLLSKIISRAESIKSLAEKYSLNNKIVIKLIKLKINEKEQLNDTLFEMLESFLNFTVKTLELYKLSLDYSNQKTSIIHVLNSCDLELISNSLGLPKEQLNNIIKYISKICDEKTSNNELESKMLNYLIKIADKHNFTQIDTKRALEFPKYNSTVSLIITLFFKKIFETFPGLKNDKINPDIINLKLNMLDLLNCDDFDLIANSLNLSKEQLKNIISHINDICDKNELESHEAIAFLTILNKSNLNSQDYNSYVTFFYGVFEFYPNILIENQKNSQIPEKSSVFSEINKSVEFNNTEPKPKLEPDVKQQEKGK